MDMGVFSRYIAYIEEEGRQQEEAVKEQEREQERASLRAEREQRLKDMGKLG